MTRTSSAVQKRAVIKRTPEEAFELFTGSIDEWWPRATHSVGLSECRAVVFESGVGGRIIETTTSGEAAVWGTVLVWEPPSRVRFTWHPGTPPSAATEVEVTFIAHDAGTVVELMHTGWDRRPDGAGARENYDRGWDAVFGRFAAAGSGALEPT